MQHGQKLTVKDLMDPEKVKPHLPALKNYFEKGGTWQHLFKISNDLMEAQYGVAHNLYTHKKFEEASSVFSYLTMLNPYEEKYWMGLGASKQFDKQHEEALQAYSLATTISPQDPAPLFQSAQCHYALEHTAECLQCLEQALVSIGNERQHDALKKQIQELISALKSQKPKR